MIFRSGFLFNDEQSDCGCKSLLRKESFLKCEKHDFSESWHLMVSILCASESGTTYVKISQVFLWPNSVFTCKTVLHMFSRSRARITATRSCGRDFSSATPTARGSRASLPLFKVAGTKTLRWGRLMTPCTAWKNANAFRCRTKHTIACCSTCVRSITNPHWLSVSSSSCGKLVRSSVPSRTASTIRQYWKELGQPLTETGQFLIGLLRWSFANSLNHWYTKSGSAK